MVLPPPPQGRPNPPRADRILPRPGHIFPRGSPPPGTTLLQAHPEGRKQEERTPGRGRPPSPLIFQAFLAGSFLVLLVNLPSLLPRGRKPGPLQEPAPAAAHALPGTFLPGDLQKVEDRLWEARAWPALWKKGPLLDKAREARDKARALGLERLAAKMEVLLEIYGPARR